MLIEILLWFHPRILSRKFMKSVRSFEFSWNLVQIMYEFYYCLDFSLNLI